MDGYTALHFAAYANKLETVMLLCRNGGSMTAKTNYQETPLKIAAIRGSLSVLKYFLDTYEFPVEEKCDVFDLLGCCWETALKLRFEVANSMTDLVMNVTPISYFQYAVEITFMDSLRQITDPNDLYMQALLKYSQIYGENHPVTIAQIVFRGTLYGDNGCFQQCVELWKYAYTLRYTEDDHINDDSIKSAISLVDIFCEMQTKWIHKKIKEQVQMTDVFDVFKLIVSQMNGGKNVRTIRPIGIIEQAN